MVPPHKHLSPFSCTVHASQLEPISTICKLVCKIAMMSWSNSSSTQSLRSTSLRLRSTKSGSHYDHLRYTKSGSHYDQLRYKDSGSDCDQFRSTKSGSHYDHLRYTNSGSQILAVPAELEQQLHPGTSTRK